MKRRFDCAGGRAAEVQRSARGKRKTLHVAKAASGQRKTQRPQTERPQHSSKPDERDRHKIGLPESPWDARLHHPWVAAYRRIHSKSKPTPST